MKFSSAPTPGRDSYSDKVFDIQGFKNLLVDLKESKRQKEEKAKPAYEIEE
jgi:hypothetical protein